MLARPLSYDAQALSLDLLLSDVKQPFALLLGERGVGKTTMLRHFCIEYTRELTVLMVV